MSEVPLLEMRGVGKSFRVPVGEREVLRDVNFSLDAGDFAVITGPSGSGKSTLLNLAALLDTPSCGWLCFEGETIEPSCRRRARAIRKRKVGMIFQHFHLLPHRSVLENVAFRYRYLGPPGADVRRRAAEVIGELGLDAVGHQPARLLSGGEMQRVAIARALVYPPRLVVADEPTGNLDRETAATVMEALQALHRKGIAVALVTHNLALLEYGTRHLVCDNGTLREVGGS